MNSVNLIGRITRDPELRSTAQGESVCSFTLAVQRAYKNAQGEYIADFINCVAWRQTAEFISKYFKKGQQMGVEGSIQTRSWDDNGTTRWATEVKVENVTFIGKVESGKTDAESSTSDSGAVLPTPEVPVDDEDLPF